MAHGVDVIITYQLIIVVPYSKVKSSKV